MATGRDRAGRDDDDLMAAFTQPRYLPDKRRHRLDVELIRARGQQTRAKLRDNALVRTTRAFRI